MTGNFKMFLSIKNYIKTLTNPKGTLFVFLMVLTGPVLSQDYNLRNFNSEEGLAQSYVYSIMQDAKGYLFVGTGNGLSRYNGFIFQNFTINDSLADNFVTCGIRDGENMWFGHMNGKISMQSKCHNRIQDL
jgi:ligand-binding sensor domain-containing protein